MIPLANQYVLYKYQPVLAAKQSLGMKDVLLSADSAPCVYSVPEEVADDLAGYCIEFCDKWLRNSPKAKRYRKGGVVYYNETSFIDYLNRYLFPDRPSVWLKNLPWDVPEEYNDYPWFNF